MECQVVEISLKVFLLEDITVDQVSEKITAFLDKGFGTDPGCWNIMRRISIKVTAMAPFSPLKRISFIRPGKFTQ